MDDGRRIRNLDEQPVAGRRTPWWERNLAWLLVAPTIVMFVVFAFIPSITTISLRLQPHQTAARRHAADVHRVRQLRARAFEDPLVRQSALTTFKWTLIVTTVEIALGLGLALLLAHGDSRARRSSARS